MRRRTILATVVLVGGLLAALGAWAVNDNPVPGSVWTYLGPTFGADWVASPLNTLPLVTAYGAVCDGVHDDGPAINAALASGVRSTGMPPGKVCLTNQTILIPDNTELVGLGFMPTYPQQQGLLCGLAVTPCVRVSNGTNRTANISGVSIFRAAGTIPAASVCVEFNSVYAARPHDVWCQNHGVGFKLVAVGTSGIYFWGTRLFTCNITADHMVIDRFPGVYVAQSTFGCNGPANASPASYVAITGNWDGTTGTIHFTDTHFNQGAGLVGCGITWRNFTGTTNVNSDFEIIGGHMEVADNFMCSDSTVKGISVMQIIGLWTHGGWGPINKLFLFDPATVINTWLFSGNIFTGWLEMRLAPTAQFNDLKIIGNSIFLPTYITGVSNSTMVMSGNTYANDVTLAGNFAAALVDGVYVGGFTHNNATGSVAVTTGGNQNSLSSCNTGFGMLINGSATGITYAFTPVCQWQLHGNLATVTFNIGLTSKGVGAGAVTLTGLPFTSQAGGQGGTVAYNTGMAGLTGGIIMVPLAGTKSANLYQQAATAVAPLTNTNLTNTSLLPRNGVVHRLGFAMKLKLLAPHVIADRWYPRGAILDPPPPGYEVTPLMEGLDDEAKGAVAYAQIKAWGRFPYPYGLYPPNYMGARPLDDPPIPRPLDDNQPVYHYVGSPEYIS